MNKGRYSLAIALCFFAFVLQSQIILNGSFALGTTSWGCSAETNAETVYGGSNGLNAVAEVDAAAGLCQTVIGLTIGNMYRLSYVCSRRVGGCPSPNPTNMLVTVSGGALSKTDVRTNTSFALTTSAYIFTATATSHVITFAAGSGFGGSTCGMIMDNIAVTLSTLPIELIYFTADPLDDKFISTNWETATELNNDFFTLERSANSIDWEVAGTVKGAGNSVQQLKYHFIDKNPYPGISYYRLKQTDFNGIYKYSAVQSVECDKKQLFTIHPNPSSDHILTLSSNNHIACDINLYNNLGELVFSSLNHNTEELNLNSLDIGIYYIAVSRNNEILYRNRIVLQ